GGRIDTRSISDGLLDDYGVTRGDLNRIAGDDHVISGAELGRLYERLAELDRQAPLPSGHPSRLDPASKLYEAFRAQIGGGTVDAFVRLPSEMLGEVDRLSALSPVGPARRGDKAPLAVSKYLDMIDAYEAKGSRPAGVTLEQYGLAKALSDQKISAADVRYYL